MSEHFEKSALIKVRSTSDGLHLDESILWFDSHSNGQLSFLSSSLYPEKISVPQVITTEETAKILESFRRRPNTLICQYNRPFSIGVLKMELLPSGCVLGGASLFVETEMGKLLYAPQLQIHRNPTVRQMQLKKAKTLILGAFHPQPGVPLPNRKREKESLLQQILSCTAQGEWPTIICNATGTAQEITKLLTDANIGVVVSPTIAKINRIYEAYGSKLGLYSVYSSKRVKNRVAIFPLATANQVRFPSVPDGPIILVKESTVEHDLDSINRLIGSYIISSQSDGPEIREIVTAVQPKEVYFFGPYTRAYVKEFEGMAPVVRALYTNDQPTLF
jgi:Cft2 family RNA processing exonuclease